MVQQATKRLVQIGRLPVLDFLRGVAILGVVLDHVLVWLGVAEQYPLLHNLTIFSVVPLFFLAGITYAFSFVRSPPLLLVRGISIWRRLWRYFAYFWHKSKRLIIAYVAGMAVILFWQNNDLSLRQWAQSLAAFPAQFYFIAIYVELLAVAPVLMWLWQKAGWSKIKLLAFWTVVLLSAIGCQKVLALPPPIWLPARQLFGGLEFIVFASGTLAGFLYANGRLRWVKKYSWALLILGILGLLIIFGLQKQLVLFAHPPQFWTIFYAVTGLALLTGIYYLTPWRWPLISWFGFYSLNIYIFHALFIQLSLQDFPVIFTWPLWSQLLFLGVATATASIVLGWLVTKALQIGHLIFHVLDIT